MKYVTINGGRIRQNIARGGAGPPMLPPIRIASSRADRAPVYCFEAEIIGPARLRYSPHQRLMRCGARLVLECEDALPRSEV